MVYETILDVTLQELKNRVSRINFQQFPFYFFVFSYTRGFFVEWCFFFFFGVMRETTSINLKVSNLS